MNAPSPWHRSRLFLLGALGLLFLLCAWFISNRAAIMGWDTETNSFQIEYQPGALIARWNSFGETVDGVTWANAETGFTREFSTVSPANRQYFSWPLSWEHQDEGQLPFSKLTIPLWFLTPLYLALWLTTLALWQRRKHRLAKAPTAPPQ